MKFLLRDYDPDSRREFIYTSLGRIPADIVLVNVNIVSPHTEEIIENACVAIKKYRIVRICDAKEAPRYVSNETLIIDGKGNYAIPGFIDLHVHIESSLLDPIGFSILALKHGTTTVVADPHEVTNVLGLEGIKVFLEASKNTPLKILIEVPSCVPSTNPQYGLETTKHQISASEIRDLLDYDNVIGLGEVMDYLSVIKGSDDLLKKIEYTRKKLLLINGHAPQLRGALLDAYISAGVLSDHETTSQDEGLEKLRKGVWLYIREGSAWRDLGKLIDLVKKETCTTCAFVSDDLNVYDLYTKGHIDRIVNLAIEYGLDPVKAIRYATFNPALRLHLEDQIGSITPGRYGDIVLSHKLEKIEPHTVFANGEIIYYQGSLQKEFERAYYPPSTLKTVKLGRFHEKISYVPDVKTTEIGILEGLATVNVIQVTPGSTLTKRMVEELVIKDGKLKASPEKDVMYVIVADRHTGSGSYSIGFIKNLRFKASAIAQTIAHDTHNLIVAGWDPEDMEIAVREIERIQGGIVIVDKRRVIAEIPLNLAGLMSIEPPEEVFEKYKQMVEALRSRYGLDFESFFMTLSLISLPVIPEVRITDKGIVDVNEARFVPLIEEVRRK